MMCPSSRDLSMIYFQVSKLIEWVTKLSMDMLLIVLRETETNTRMRKSSSSKSIRLCNCTRPCKLVTPPWW
jgi:hypothetical protein